MSKLSPIAFSKEDFVKELEGLAKAGKAAATTSRKVAELLDQGDALRTLRDEYNVPTLADVGASVAEGSGPGELPVPFCSERSLPS